MVITVTDIIRNAKRRTVDIERQKSFATQRVQAELKITVAEARAQVDSAWEGVSTDGPTAPHGPVRTPPDVSHTDRAPAPPTGPTIEDLRSVIASQEASLASATETLAQQNDTIAAQSAAIDSLKDELGSEQTCTQLTQDALDQANATIAAMTKAPEPPPPAPPADDVPPSETPAP